MKPNFLILIGCLLVSVSLPAAPVFKVTKDGKTNWLIGTVHDLRPLESEIPDTITKLVSRARVVLNESGDRYQSVIGSVITRHATSERHNRNWLQSLSIDEYAKLSELALGTGLTSKGLQSMHSLNLYVGLSHLFGTTEQRYMNEKLFLVATEPEREKQITKRMMDILRDQKVSMNFQYPLVATSLFNRTPQPRESIDATLTTIAERNQIPVRALDREGPIRAALSQKFEGEELGQYIRNWFRRLDKIKKMKAEETLPILIEHFSMMGVNAWFKYCRWTPETPPFFGVPVNAELGEPLIPKLMRELLNRHDHWMPAIEREFAVGDTVVVVGAGHLTEKFNPKGLTLVDKLILSGHQVEFVSTKPCD